MTKFRGLTEDKFHSDITLNSRDFLDFKRENLPVHFTIYEKACNFCSKIQIKPDKKKQVELQEALTTCHLYTTPEGVTSFSIFFPLAFIFIGLFFAYLISMYFIGAESFLFFVIVVLLLGVLMIFPLSTLPLIMANSWRLRASNQMVLSVFYLVSYMRHTSNLELALKFTSDHIVPPLSIDFKKILWDVETSRFDSVKDSLDNYLKTWKKYNMEYVESMHLIESSLYEANEKKRVITLEKAMSLILEATYEKMLHFAQNLKSPITMLHMLGIILPILGLVILPLVVSFMGDVKWYHLSVLYNLFLPILVWYLGKVILSTRPSGYGQADIIEINPDLKKFTTINISIASKKFFKINPKWIALILILIFTLIGLSPLIINTYYRMKGETFDIILNQKDKLERISDLEKLTNSKFAFLEYKMIDGQLMGPFGLGATLLSIAIPFGLAFGLSFYYKSVTNKLISIRDRTKELENEFASALFQLGNRVGDGLPAEIAFSKVAQITENTTSGKFFTIISNNIATMGMGVSDAIFDPKYGAINKFPSALIESSMKVFIEGAKKGSDVAAEALINISTYIKEMHKVDERLKDLMSEITSSMSSQINFLAPLIAGIVIGLTSMITFILSKLSSQLNNMSADSGGQGALLGDLFKESIPTFYFQLVVGLYIVEITYLLTTMLNTIQNGYDPLNEKFLLGQYFLRSGVLYCFVSLSVILIFNLIAVTVISGMNIIP